MKDLNIENPLFEIEAEMRRKTISAIQFFILWLSIGILVFSVIFFSIKNIIGGYILLIVALVLFFFSLNRKLIRKIFVN